MKDIVVKSGKKRCRFHSLANLVDYYINEGVWFNVGFALRDVVQCNIEYRNYLRDNGYPATIERLKSEAPGLCRIQDVFKVLDDWWSKVESDGGLGDYDIQCYELTDSFTLLGEKFNGLDSVRSIVNASRNNENNNSQDQKWEKYSSMSEEDRYPDNRKNKNSSLFAAEVWERYPCFDSADLLYEDRCFRCYYVRYYRINEEFFRNFSIVHFMDMIRENISLPELPLVYYDGDSNVMYVMSERVIDSNYQ